MESLALLLVVAAGLATFFVAPRCPCSLRWLLFVTGLVSAVGAYSLFVMPSDFLVRHPAAATALHPWLAALYGGIAFVLFSGIALGLIAHRIYKALHVRNVSPNGRNV
jgi:hypothetical protein